VIVHHPFKFHIAPLPPLTGFGIAMVLAFVIAQYAAETEMDRRGYDSKQFADVTLAAVIGGLLGAKIYYAILHHETLFSRDGFVFWGGLIGGTIACTIVVMWKRLGFNRMSDIIAPGLAAAYAVGRTGCWAVGDDYGGVWSGPFAVQFPEGAPPSTAGVLRSFNVDIPLSIPDATPMAVHPTQIYEVILGMVMFAILWKLRDHKHAAGWLFGLYFALAGAERFVVEFFRAKDDRFFGPLTIAQLIAIACMVFGVMFMRMRRTPTAEHPGIYAPIENARA
jgi:phosphatidylglycerol:prolipoprotein diacylglycerol transferase